MSRPDTNRHVKRKAAFIRELAKFLVEGQALKFLESGNGKPLAAEWAELRLATPLSGYVTQEEAERLLTKFLE